MRPRLRASLLWGAVGALSFLVLLQGYELLADWRVSYALKLGVAALVAAGAFGATYALDGRLSGAKGRV